MAPKKRKSSEVSPNRELVIKPTARTEPNRRVTRSLSIKEGGVSSSSSPSTRRSSSSSSAAAAARKQASSSSASASKKKGKKPMKKPPPKKPKTTPKTDDESDDDAKSVTIENTSDSDDVKKSASDNDDDDDGHKNVAEAGGSSSSKTTIIIEHCKQCTSFKKRANEASAGLKKSIPGINVLINPDKPRKGCFEIRAEDGKAFVSLLDMKRPFKKMKDLDMDEVVADIVKEIGE